jgi:modification methylase
LSASNPILRDIHEYILVFSKGEMKRNAKGKENTITKEQFMSWTKSIWTMNAESARKIGHPAPFPEELPLRLIHLYFFKNDIILDPFIGSGTTAVAAIKAERKFVGYDIVEEYVKLSNKRLSKYLDQNKFSFESSKKKTDIYTLSIQKETSVADKTRKKSKKQKP